MIAFLYDLIYMIPLCLMGILFGGPYIRMPEENTAACIIGILVLIWIAGIRHTEKRIRIGVLGLPIVIGAVAVWQMDVEERNLFLEENWWIFWVFVFVILSLILGLLMEGFYKFRLCIGVLLTAGMVFLVVSHGKFQPVEGGLSKLGTALYFFEIAVIIVEQVQIGWKKSGYKETKAHLVNVAPFLLALCMLVYLIPAAEKPYDWDWAKKLVERVSTSIKEFTSTWFYDEDYGITGYSDENGFVGSLEGEEVDVIKVTFGPYSPDVMYLSGKVFDTFNGRSWTSEKEYGNKERMIDFYETLYAVQKYDRPYSRDYYMETNVTIENLLPNSRNLWVNSKSNMLTTKLENIPYEETEGSLKTLEKIKLNESYLLSFMRINRDQEIFSKLVNEAELLQKTEWLQKERPYAYEDYIEYRVSLQQNYSENIKLSDGLKKVLDELFEGADNDFQKMMRLEKYLGSMTYSWNPGVLPDYVNSAESFLDYFVLEKKEGYCVHFATAFALIARTYGLPSRFVQGYSFPKMAGGVTVVTSMNSHAWAEVYFKNVGWIQFEATPGYSYGRGWNVTDRDFEYQQPTDIYGNKHEGEAGGPTEVEVEEEEEEPFNPFVVIIPVGVGILFILGFILINKFSTRRSYERLDNAGKLCTLSKQNFKLLRMLGYSVEEGETLQEFYERILRSRAGNSKAGNSNIANEKAENSKAENRKAENSKAEDSKTEDSKTAVSEVAALYIKVYEEYIYSENAVTSEMIEITKLSNSELKQKVKSISMWYKIWLLLT